VTSKLEKFLSQICLNSKPLKSITKFSKILRCYIAACGRAAIFDYCLYRLHIDEVFLYTALYQSFAVYASYLLVCNKVELQRVKQTIATDDQLSEDKNQFTCQTV
jgi:hypothetical protein